MKLYRNIHAASVAHGLRADRDALRCLLRAWLPLCAARFPEALAARVARAIVEAAPPPPGPAVVEAVSEKLEQRLSTAA